MDSTIGPVCPRLGETWPTISPRVTSMWQLRGESPCHVEFLVLVCCQNEVGQQPHFPLGCEIVWPGSKAMSVLEGEHYTHLCLHVLSSCAAVRRYTDSILSRAGFSALSLQKQGNPLFSEIEQLSRV